DSGQLGDGSTNQSEVPVAVAGLSGVIAISAGQYHTCALTSGGGIKCWGDNQFGELGNGHTVGKREPVDVSGLDAGVAAVSAGQGFTCVAMAAGGIKCWGGNSDGQLGDGSTAQKKLVPVDVLNL